LANIIPDFAFRRHFLFAGFATILAIVSPALSKAANVSNELATQEMVIGHPDAPVTIIEYASLGCSHCASFHQNTYPEIKKTYIDTGKVKLIYRDYPLGTPALAASMISRCGGPSKYFGMVDIFFRSQRQWASSENPINALGQMARFGGMSTDDINACLQNQALMDHIQGVAKHGQDKFDVNSTPTFIIDDEKIEGAQNFETFKKIIDKALN